MSENQSVNEYKRKVTAAERFFARSPFAIITMVLRIKGQVSEEIWNSCSMNREKPLVLKMVTKEGLK